MRKTLFDDPAFEKTAIATYLANTLSLNQMLTIEKLVRTGKIRKLINVIDTSEQINESDTTEPAKTVRGQRLRYMIID